MVDDEALEDFDVAEPITTLDEAKEEEEGEEGKKEEEKEKKKLSGAVRKVSSEERKQQNKKNKLALQIANEKYYNAVVVGLSPSSCDYDFLSSALRVLLKSPDAPLLGIHAAKYVVDADSKMLCAGPGTVIKGLEYSSGRDCKILGKPNRDFFKAACSSMNVAYEDYGKVIMIGDDVLSDIGGAAQLGIRGMLVKTGKFLPKDLETKEFKGEYTVGSFDNIWECVNHILGPYQKPEPPFIHAEAKDDYLEEDAPFSPREEKMVGEIDRLRTQVEGMEGKSPVKALDLDFSKMEEKPGAEEEGKEEVKEEEGKEGTKEEEENPETEVNPPKADEQPEINK
jgi:ribonucleotide monophosphatase NagD (HAD superfamily)